MLLFTITHIRLHVTRENKRYNFLCAITRYDGYSNEVKKIASKQTEVNGGNYEI